MKKYKWFFVWNYEKEENWINEMSKKGFQLTKVGFAQYWFKKDVINYTYRIELLQNDIRSKEANDYIDFLNDVDIDVAAVFSNYIYLRKQGELELFSDNSSKTTYLLRIRNLILKSLFPLSSICIVYSIISINSTFNLFTRSIFFTLAFGFVISLFLLLIYGVFKIQSKLNSLKE